MPPRKSRSRSGAQQRAPPATEEAHAGETKEASVGAAGMEEEKTTAADEEKQPQASSTDATMATSSEAAETAGSDGGADAPMEDVHHLPLTGVEQQPPSAVVAIFTADQLLESPPKENAPAAATTDTAAIDASGGGDAGQPHVEGEEPQAKRAKTTPEMMTTSSTAAADVIASDSDVKMETAEQQQVSMLPPRPSATSIVAAGDVGSQLSSGLPPSLRGIRPLPDQIGSAAMDTSGSGDAASGGQVEGKTVDDAAGAGSEIRSTTQSRLPTRHGAESGVDQRTTPKKKQQPVLGGLRGSSARLSIKTSGPPGGAMHPPLTRQQILIPPQQLVGAEYDPHAMQPPQQQMDGFHNATLEELLQQTGLFRQWVNPHTGQIDEKLYALISEYDPNENYFSFPIHNQPQTIEEARFTQEQMMQELDATAATYQQHVEADLNLRQQQSLRFLESSESFKLGLVQRQAVLEEKAQAIVEDKVQLQEAEEKMRQVQTMQVMNLM